MENIKITSQFVDSLLFSRDENGHKYKFGHVLLVCGQSGMMGGAVLAVRGALRSGCGLVTVHIPESERFILQTTCPSAMLSLDSRPFFSEILPYEKFDAVGIGCALDLEPETINAIDFLLERCIKPVVFDADALNILAKKVDFQPLIPKNSILTPHDGELRRLIGDWKNDAEKTQEIACFANKLNAIIVAKGANTRIFSPDGSVFQNTTGNAGMAKAGSGDVLTGLISGLLARGYAPINAAILGVYFHGLAGDHAAAHFGQESMNSEDIASEIRILHSKK
ncbi:MAG: NAD(P)H-hydrate dehydratase [Prevotellaceae bacterium]|jgi:NAD(P)H-hydrate epimerase|nr:NAD(P)H-hydrate dehydratase [Prevotellaceae bacterium]